MHGWRDGIDVWLRFVLSTCTVAAICGLPRTLPAQGDAQTERGDTRIHARYELGGGDVDLTAGIGLNRRLRLEPGLEIGVARRGELATFSAGLGLEVGYAPLCGFWKALQDGCTRRVWDVMPKASAALHTSLFGDTTDLPIGVYAGASAGPDVYLYRAVVEGTERRAAAFTTV